MRFTDPEVNRWIKQLKSPDIIESLDEYPDSERDGKSDIQIFAEEVDYWKSCFEEDGHRLHDELKEAQNIISVTKNGTEFPWDYFGNSLSNPMLSKDIEEIKSQIKDANEIVSEYKQLYDISKKLQKL